MDQLDRVPYSVRIRAASLFGEEVLPELEGLVAGTPECPDLSQLKTRFISLAVAAGIDQHAAAALFEEDAAWGQAITLT